MTARGRLAALLGHLRGRRPERPATLAGGSLADALHEALDRDPGRPALSVPDGVLGRGELMRLGERVARWALQQGVGRGDAVVLFGLGTAELLPLWLGLGRIGANVAAIGRDLDAAAAAAAVDRAGARLLVVAAAAADRFEATVPLLTRFCPVWLTGPAAGSYLRLDRTLPHYSDRPLGPRERPAPNPEDGGLAAANAIDGATEGAGDGAVLVFDGARLARIAAGLALGLRLGGRDRVAACDPPDPVTVPVLAAALLAGAEIVGIAEASPAGAAAAATVLAGTARGLRRLAAALPASAARPRLALACGDAAAAGWLAPRPGMRTMVWDPAGPADRPVPVP